MASRNLNFPQSYGSGVVYVPFSFFLLATGGGATAELLPSETHPPDEYSFRVLISPSGGPGQPNRVQVFLVDTYKELLSVTMQAGQSDPELYALYAGSTFDFDGKWGVGIDMYRNTAGVFTPEYYNASFNGLFVVRNSSTKF